MVRTTVDSCMRQESVLGSDNMAKPVCKCTEGLVLGRQGVGHRDMPPQQLVGLEIAGMGSQSLLGALQHSASVLQQR